MAREGSKLERIRASDAFTTFVVCTAIFSVCIKVAMVILTMLNECRTPLCMTLYVHEEPAACKLS